MTISQLYTKFTLPPNLQRHMFEVAKVGEWVADHWAGDAIDTALIVKICLLHDVGNLVKFKRPFLGELEPEAAKWERLQTAMIEKYGDDAFLATAQMLTEAGVDSLFTQAVKDLQFTWSEGKSAVDWEVRIADFADCCVVPKGIVGYEARLVDLKNRYSHRDPAVWAKLDKNTQLIVEHVDTSLDQITELKVSEEDVGRYEEVEI